LAPPAIVVSLELLVWLLDRRARHTVVFQEARHSRWALPFIGELLTWCNPGLDRR
jgi:hypothetical protein